MDRSRKKRLFRILQKEQPPTAKIDCLNCGTAVDGSFCTACGQAVTVARYSIKGFAREVYDQFRKFDALKIIRTFIQLCWRPGPFVREYLAGMRVDFQGPIKYFFYGFVLQVGAAFAVHLVLARDFTSLSTGSDLKSQIFSFVSTVFWGLCWWIVYRRSGLNFAENIIASIYFTAQTFIFSIALHIVIGLFVDTDLYGDMTYEIVFVVVYLLYSLHFVNGLFREPLWKQLLKQVAAIVMYIFLVSAVLFGLVLTEPELLIPSANSNSNANSNIAH